MRTVKYLSYFFYAVFGSVIPQNSLNAGSKVLINPNVSPDLFNDLEESSRIVDISYCVGITGTGIQKPFTCASRCHEFENFELVTMWNTGQLMSDSCGYIALSHPPSPPRIIVAFRGTYSVANTIVDLSTIPQEYVPYPGGDDDDDGYEHLKDETLLKRRTINPEKAECTNCTVHMGFMTSWQYTKPFILPHLKSLLKEYPAYQLSLVGHSLGGAVAALASLDFQARGWNPQVTTFGEPRIGNQGLIKYLDSYFAREDGSTTGMYRRVTHVDDPVPLLPLTEWGYQPHAGEIYISKPDLPPEAHDLYFCNGDADPQCIAGAENAREGLKRLSIDEQADIESLKDWWNQTKDTMSLPARWKIWQIFFAHRDYFWRLGLCVSRDWHGLYPPDIDGDLTEL